MTRQIRKYLRDFLAIIFMIVVAAGVGGYILSNQRFYLPAWVPVVGTDFYKVKAELETAQAVVPGQGQSVNIAGVKIGDIGSVKLEDGRAVVDMNIRRKYAPIYKDASILLRPKTGLKDMFLELDPGNKAAGELEEGDRVPVAQHHPRRQPRRDPRVARHRHAGLPAGAAQRRRRGPARAMPPRSCARRFKRFEPLSRDGRKATRLLVSRRRNIRRTITQLPGARHRARFRGPRPGGADRLGQRELRGDRRRRTPTCARRCACSPARSRRLATRWPTSGRSPATSGRRSASCAPAPARSRRPCAPRGRSCAPPPRRSATRSARSPATCAPRCATSAAPRRTWPSSPRSLTNSFKVLNSLFNTLAYNPRGAEEGYLFWASWLNHAGAGLFAQQDAHGPVRRGLVLISCPS